MAGTGRFSGIFRAFQLIWLSVQCNTLSLSSPVPTYQLTKIVHYDAFKEAIRKDGLGSLKHPQRIRDTAVAKLFIKTCKFPVLNPNTYILTFVHSRRFHRLRKHHLCPFSCPLRSRQNTRTWARTRQPNPPLCSISRRHNIRR